MLYLRSLRQIIATDNRRDIFNSDSEISSIFGLNIEKWMANAYSGPLTEQFGGKLQCARKDLVMFSLPSLFSKMGRG